MLPIKLEADVDTVSPIADDQKYSTQYKHALIQTQTYTEQKKNNINCENCLYLFSM